LNAREIIVDSFAGGGGASLGIEMALGRSPDVAINHDSDALAMHAVNHPATLHLNSNIWKIDPDMVGPGRPIGLLWASPDCKHHSKAKGGKPLSRNIRDLAWVIVMWAQRRRPRVICLENVEEFRDWGPLDADDRPIAARRGETFAKWTGRLKKLGYRVEHRELRACDHGAPTIRKRLFLVARRDGAPIVWPEPTHGDPKSEAVRSGRLAPWRTAAEIIDWSLPCASIFLTREEGRALGVNRPLAEATMARIAKGVQRYVLGAAEPFLAPVGASRAAVHLTKFSENSTGVRPYEPLHTVMAGAPRHGLVAAFLAQHNTGLIGRGAEAPVSTITARGSNQAIVSAGLLSLKGRERRASNIGAPHPTVTAQGTHSAHVLAFLTKYYGEGGQGQTPGDPLHTVPTRDRFGLVTVRGEPYAIVDIGMRMLRPRELFRAQGFPDHYVIDRRPDGSALTATASVRMCGNSVSPVMARALVAANYRPDETGAEGPDAPLPLFREAAE
jgi:DNA (cytosine-5)-methyltransferase 1